MFVPSHYRIEDEEWHRRIIDGHPLATLTTNGETTPWATRLPALVAPGEPESGPLAGTEIVGHLNRANPHWKALADGTHARLMFDGPGGFVTPAVYPCDPSAPTWNFAAVHICGRLRLIREPEETLEVVRWTAERLEGRFGAGWDQTSSVDYFRRIVRGVGAFRLSPHSCDMVAVAGSFRAVLDGGLGSDEAMARLTGLGIDAPFANGFVQGATGADYTRDTAPSAP